ncbi:unnamed protein product [Darwinula stevensoni]|uniref:Chromo domain-containing protein n=1 Tax=Darwinula stevensoni TaxID=69355 RepID=A0A7R9AC66_9CRUS|nr:unnamed protein product [Darwinula stevensoni]CAG0900099.1 unnamed protein product [Darwinula stevensoni]
MHVVGDMINEKFNIFSEENSWEPVENLLCHGLIAEFEKKRAEAEQDEKTKKKKNVDPVVALPSCNGLERGWKLEKIIGATEVNAEKMLFVKWKERDEIEVVPSKELRKQHADSIINFYESRIMWVSGEKKEK